MNWCCPEFRNYFANNTRKGFAIFVRNENDQTNFIISYCAVDQKDESKFKQLVKSKVSVKTSDQFKFSYCPWCAVDLIGHYKDNLTAMID
jgi:hypothetical protein